MAATKDAMAAAGALGGSLGGGVDSAFAARGGAAGGRFGARFTRPRSAANLVEVRHEAAAVRACARAEIARRGVVIDDPNVAGRWIDLGRRRLGGVGHVARAGPSPRRAGARGRLVACTFAPPAARA